jgi:hypothetical protein
MSRAEIERAVDLGLFDPYIQNIKDQNYYLTYRENWEAWLHDMIDWRGSEPAPYQVRTGQNLIQYRREAVRGPRGPGKTADGSLVFHWFSSTREAAGIDWRIGITASHWRQLTKFFFPEVHKWAGRIKWGKMPFDRYSNYQLMKQSLDLNYGHAYAAASDDHETLEGLHGEETLYIFDESKIIPDATWDSIEGTFMSVGEGYWLALSTPGAPIGRFYQIHKRAPGFEDWHTTHITIEEAIKAGRIKAEAVEQRKKQWGEESALYQTQILGEFAADEEDAVIPLAWVEAAIERWHELNDQDKLEDMNVEKIGLDVARTGEDATVFSLRSGNTIVSLAKFHKEETMETAGRAAAYLRKYSGDTEVIVDTIGVGAGTYDRLKEDGFKARSFNASEGTDRTDRSGSFGFRNTRSAAWWNMREMLDPANKEKVALPPDDELTGDLTAPKYKIISGGKIQIESKDDIKKRLGRSPDCGDSVIQAFWETTKGGIFV